MRNFSCRRIIAFVLVFAMLLPMFQGLGTIAFAQDSADPIILIAGSDYQQGWYDKSDIGESDGGEIVTQESIDTWGEQSGSEFRAILDAMAGDYKNAVDGIMFCGDYSRWFMYQEDAWKDDSIYEMVKLKKHLSESGLMEADADSFYLQGNHETKEVDYAAWNGQLAPHYGQADDSEGSRGYGVFAMNEDVFPWQQGQTDGTLDTVRNTARELKEYLDYTRQTYGADYPVFVLSHVPLHYTSRTYLAGDNLYAKYILDVLNEAGANGQTIIFLYGHNHSAGFDDYLGGSTVYIPRGDTLWVANPNGQTIYPQERVLNFTYMNAGFVGYYDTDQEAIDSDLTMSMFIIENGQITVKRYDKNGEHAVKKTAGQWYTGLEDGRLHDRQYGYTINSKTYANPQSIDINELELNLPVSLLGEKLFHVGEYAGVSVANPTAGASYSWTVSDPTVLSLTSSGTDGVVLNGLEAGTALVTVTESGTGNTASFAVDVRGKGEAVMLPATSSKEIYSLTSTFKDGHVYMIANSKVPDDPKTMVMLAPRGSTDKVTEGTQSIQCYPNGTPYIEQNGDYGNYELFVFEQAPDMPKGVGKLRTFGSNWLHGQDWLFHYLRSDTHFWTWVTLDATGIDYRSSLWGFRDDCVYNCQDDGQNAWWMYYPNLGDTYTDSWKPYIFGLARTWDSALAYNTYIYEKTYLDTAVTFSEKSAVLTARSGVASGSENLGISMILTRKDGKISYVPVTLDMITGWPEGVSVSADGVVSGLRSGTYSGLGVKYQDTLVCGDLVLTVSDSEPVSVTVPATYYYRLTNNLVDGKEYIIVNRNTPGTAQVVTYANANAIISTTSAQAQVYLDASGIPCVRIADGSWNDGMSRFTFDQVGVSQGSVYGTFDAAGLSGVNYLDSSTEVYVYDYSTEVPTINNADAYQPYQTQYGFCFSYWPDDGGLCAFRINSVNGWRITYFNNVQQRFLSMNASDRNDTAQVYLYERVELTEQTYELFGDTGMVQVQEANAEAKKTGSFIKIEQADGAVEYVQITTDMLYTNTDGTNTKLSADALTKECRITGLSVIYNGEVVSDDYTLIVASSDSVSAEYPNPGAVRVDKKLNTSENAYYSTGVARIDLSVTGIPKQQGVDLLLVVDTSSSMNQTVDETGITRIQALQNAVGELITQLKVPNEDGTLPDIELGIVQFNDHTYFDSRDHLYGSKVFKYFNNENRSGIVQEFSNINTLSFDPEVITTKSGTNYDVGLQYAYNYLSEKKAANLAQGDDRKQVVVFMSDGICYQYNWLSNDANSSEGSSGWKTWLEGTSDEVLCDGSQTYLQELTSSRGAYYAELFHTEGKNWIAEAIKGEAPEATAQKPTVDVTATDDDVINGYYKVVFREERVNPNTYEGAEPPVSLQDSWRWVPGLGATIYSIGFGLSDENSISVDTGRHVLKMIATDPSMYTDAGDASSLHQAFRTIGQSLRTAGDDATMMDMMGLDFDLQMAEVKDDEGNATGFKPSIVVTNYELYKLGEVGQVINGVAVTEAMVGTRKTSSPNALFEKVTFSDDGTQAFSDRLSGNILIDGVIYASTFWYNTTANAVTIDRDGDGTAETTLPAETFCWNVGDITEQELVLSYYVYLTGSTGADAYREAGNYPTNEYATLTYTDHNGNTETKETVSPILPWKQAQVTYGYYLVDANGNVLVNYMEGTTGSFANKIPIGSLTTQSMTLNEEAGITIVAGRQGNLPEGYVLFDPSAAYNVHAHSGGGGSWTVTQGADKKATTYVAGYGGNPTLELSSTNAVGYDYSHTIVWFAVTFADADMFVNKTVSATDDPNRFDLTLEAFAAGSTVMRPITKPADIVLVLDQSASMYTPKGADADIYDRFYSQDANQNLVKISTDDLDAEKASHLGYYVAQTKTRNRTAQEDASHDYNGNGITGELLYIYDWFIVQYVEGTGWVYVRVANTHTPVNVDPANLQSYISNDGGAQYNKTVVNPDGSGNPITGFNYYQSQFGALYDSVNDFVSGLAAASEETGSEHRVAITGFSSPYYDGISNYNGTGMYIDGSYYLYDADYMYTGYASSANPNGYMLYVTDAMYESMAGDLPAALENITWSRTVPAGATLIRMDPNKSNSGSSVVGTNGVTYQAQHYFAAFPASGTQLSYNPLTEDLYDNALVNVGKGSVNPGVSASIEAIRTNYLQTCPAAGLDMAKKIFEANPVSDRDQIVVLFTDGVPTVPLDANRGHGENGKAVVRELHWSGIAGAKDAINLANDMKTAGVQIYTIGTSALTASVPVNPTNKVNNPSVTSISGESFLNYVSSNMENVTATHQATAVSGNDTALAESKLSLYQNGVHLNASNPPVASDSIYAKTSADGDFSVAFGEIMYAVSSPNVTLGEEAVLKEVLSDYFDLDALNPDEIEVLVAPYTGVASDGRYTFGTPVPAEQEGFDIEVSFASTSDRQNVEVLVKGFSYSDHYVRKNNDTGAYEGYKLLVKVPVKSREGFWGGNNVPTNSKDTAIYSGDGTPVVEFPMPEVNVPADPQIITQDKTVYYGDQVGSEELVDKITVGGVEVEISDTGIITPTQDWMDDYADLIWTEGSVIPGQSEIDSSDTGDHTYSVTLIPKHDGSENLSDNPSNMAGAVVEDAVAEDTATVYVLFPVITWKDVVINLGDAVDEEFFKENDFVRLTWVEKSLTEDLAVDADSIPGYDPESGAYPNPNPNNIPVPDHEPPELTYQYSVSGKPVEYTPVDVDVISSNGDENITDVVTFLWETCTWENGTHKQDKDQISAHQGSTAFREFYIHVVGGDVLVSNKQVSAVDGETDVFDLTMEGYVTGSIEQITVTKPADIVLVLDHSGSMRTPSGAPKVLDTSELYSTTGHLPSDQLDQTKGTHMGYYVAQSTTSKAWFIMQFADGKWHFYSVPTTESIVNTDGGWTEHTLHLSWTQEQLKTDSAAKNLVYYYSQYATLYDSVLEFVKDLRTSGVEHSVAIVGFAGPNSQGSRVYVSGYNSRTGQEETSYKSYNAMYHVNTTDERRAELFHMAMKNVQDDTQYNELLANIESIETNFSFTCPSSGLKLADDLYQANAANRDTDRDRIMVLFTDGIPNRSAQDWVSNKDEDNADGNGAASKLTQTEIYNEIISMAHKIKAAPEDGGHGATIYSVSTTTLVNTTAAENDPRTFLHYSSSDYPDATSLTDAGTPIAVPKYTSEVNGVDDLELMFDSVTKEVAGTDVNLDATAVLKDTLTDYIELTDDVQIDVYTQKYLGDNNWAEPVPFPNAIVNVTSSVEGGRLDTISVSGFDYGKEYISQDVRTQTITGEDGQPVTVADYRGSKLVVKVRVKARDGFWGGNNVPTNQNDAGIYGEGNEMLSKFPEPQVNIPVKPVVSGKDQTVYYGEDGLDALEDLVDKITVGTTENGNGEEVGIEVTYDRETGKFVPQEDWMDDFADLSWNPDLLNPADPDTVISGTDPDDYTFGVVLTPKTDGTSNDNGTGGNIAGDPVDPDDGIASDEATGSVDVLVPVIRFEDSTIELGDVVDETYYSNTNRQDGVQWVNKEDPYNSEQPTATFGTEPELTVTYTPVTDEQDYFTKDTPVNVEVHLGTEATEDSKITNEVYFDWTGCDNEDLHDENETVADDVTDDDIHRHKGDVTSPEFYIHLTYVLKEDTVVIDFGLKVDIDVLMNDSLPEGTLINSISFADQIPGAFTQGIAAGYDVSQDGSHGEMAVVTEDGKSLLRYTPADMEMNGKEVFIYAVANGTGEDARFYYTPVTVIPATVIYYEDSFLEYSVTTISGEDQTTVTGSHTWNTVGEAQDDTQAEDRPGQALDCLDANNIYGYDEAYKDMTTYSNGSAKWVTVRKNVTAAATFRYWGTGFDVVSLTNSDSGTILVIVKDLLKETTKYYMVDTYYGYRYNGELGQWEVDPTDSDTLYQVPVMKIDSGAYSHYEITIECSYGDLFDHGQNDNSGSYNFYLDAIRIYNPAQQAEDGSISDEVINNAYNNDFETNPIYTELRNLLIEANTFNELGDSEETAGVIFIDGNKTLSEGENGSHESVQEPEKSFAVSEYMNYGPNNELYLAPNQAVSFALDTVAPNGRVHLALKSVGDFGGDEVQQDGVENNDGYGDNGGTVTVEIYGVNADGTRKSIVEGDQMTLSTATDLYYDITGLAGTTVVIRNKGDAGIVSVTNIKTTGYSSAAQTVGLFTVSRSSAAQALAALNEGAQVPVEPTEGSIHLQYATATFEEEVKLNIYFDTDLTVAPEELGLITFSSQLANGTLDNAEAVISGAVQRADGSYGVTTEGIAAKNLADDIWFRVYARLADGTVVYSKMVSYSPKAYAMTILAGDYSVEVKSLVVAMLNYGAAAQTYFGHHTDALANAALTAEQQALVGSYREDMFRGICEPETGKLGSFAATDNSFTRKYPTVFFQGAFAISYHMTAAVEPDEAPVLYYWTEDAYHAAAELTAENASGVLTMTGAGDYSATVSGIAPKDMNSTVFVAAVYEAQGQTHCSGVLPYSLGAYFAQQAQSETGIAALAKAAAVYGNAAEACFG